MLKLNWFLFSFLFIVSSSYAQEFKWKANVEKVNEDQYYKIILNPQITSHLRQDYGDVRIFNNNGNEIPYLLKTSESVNLSSEFKNYEIIERNYKKGCCTYLIIHNRSKEKIDNLILKIKNADANKKIKLSGSEDNKSWFIIKEDYEFNSIYSSTESVVEQMFSFPLSDYEFFRIDIDDSLSNPVNILNAGYYVSKSQNADFINVPVSSIFQSDSLKQKKSFVHIVFDKPYYLEKIVFEIDGQENFYRGAELMIKDPYDTTGKFIFYRGVILSSRSENSINLNKDWVKEMRLIIYNEDNTPLKISKIKAAARKSFLIAHLNPKDSFTLKYSDKNLSSPNYDLKFYEDKIPATLIEVNVGSAINIENQKEIKPAFTPFFKSNWFIWGAIMLVALLLGFMTVRMMRDMKDNVNNS